MKLQLRSIHNVSLPHNDISLPSALLDGKCNSVIQTDGLFIMGEKGIGRFAFKFPTWIIIKKNHLTSHTGVK